MIHKIKKITLCLMMLIAASTCAAADRQIDVVKIMSFSCPICRESEAQDVVIAEKITQEGGRFVFAPVPTVAAEGFFKELVYYGARTLGGRTADNVKLSLYRGVQDQGISFTDFLQAYVWLQSDPKYTEQQLQDIFKEAQSANAKAALTRASTLAVRTGVQNLPAYVLIVDGEPHSIVDPTLVPGGSLLSLREEILSRVLKLRKGESQ